MTLDRMPCAQEEADEREEERAYQLTGDRGGQMRMRETRMILGTHVRAFLDGENRRR